jgi:NAD(P)-dependent dehydrogenase (short-subunit alcohol dehydrogenase family)
MMAESAQFLHRLFSLEGKVALITGASGGIGRALAVGLAEAGAAVAVHGRKADEIDATCQLVEAVGGKTLPITAELADVESVRGIATTTYNKFKRLDVLVNCAGMNRRKPIVEVTEGDFDTIMAVNLKSIYFLTQAAYPYLRERGGKVIHIGSINAYYGLDTVSVYGASKGGLNQLTKVMAVEWAEDNIQINCVVPGFIYTALAKPLWADERRAHWFRSRIPMRRPGLPEDLVGVTLFLATPASDYVTGQSFIVDGGFTAGGSWHRDEMV